jgi:hypothetical protein
MTVSIDLRNIHGIAKASDMNQSFRNHDGTLTEVPGHKMTQSSGKGVCAIVGTGSFAGVSHLLTVNSLHRDGEELSSRETGERWVEKIPSLLPLCGVDDEAAKMAWFCGIIPALDASVDGALFSAVRALPSSPHDREVSKAFDAVLDATETLRDKLEEDGALNGFNREAARLALSGLTRQTLAQHLCDELGIDHVPSKAQEARVVDLAVALATKDYDGRDEARLIFSGFGANEIVATIAVVSFYGIIGDQVLYSMELDDPTKGDPITTVRTFAQSDGQSALMHGMYEDDVEGFSTTAGDIAKEMFGLTDEQGAKMSERVQEVTTYHLRSNYFEPFLRTVSGLSVEGLARVADLLCRVQELRAASAYTEASVGGVIEVVTITKRDGIVWHRRLSSGLNANEGGLLE